MQLGIIYPDEPEQSELLTLDLDAALGLGGRCTFRVARSAAFGGHTIAGLFQTGDIAVLAPAAEELAAGQPAGIVWACTSGSFIGGLDWARQQVRELTRLTGIPAYSTTLALIDVAQRMGIARAELLAAYPGDVTAHLVACLEAAGIAVERVRSLDCATGTISAALDLEAVLRSFRTGTAGPHLPVLIPDTAIDTLSIYPALVAAWPEGVLTSNLASILGPVRDCAEAGGHEDIVRAAEDSLARFIFGRAPAITA